MSIMIRLCRGRLQLDDILDEFVNEYQGDTKASFDFIEYVKIVSKTRKKIRL